ncbi:MAG: hypothetical protein IT236_16630 [Bacteroidia bacterium]|nr:hypothetical protein [Bacteroidia bacterium]
MLSAILLNTNLTRAQQNYKPEEKLYRTHIEFMALPALMFNSITFGVSKHTSENREHVITLSAQSLFVEPPIYGSLAARYNYNIYLNQECRFRAYVPMWCGARYLIASGGGESDALPYQVFLYTVGTGIGLKYEFKNQHKIRFELGVGASLYTESNQTRNLNGFAVQRGNPVIPAFRGGFKYLIPIGK